MLISLELEYFRKHTGRKLLFTKGLNTIRGMNEGGKTSLLLAILYALYGAKAMPLPMEDMVTWGEPVKKLRVTLVMSKGDRMFTFTRSTAGAECNFDGGVVTGQNEVSKFAAELLGADMNKAQKLMFASQKGLAASLEGGSTAIAEYIEELSGMDLFDKLLDAAADHLATGPTTTLDAAIAEAEEASKEEPTPPNLEMLRWNVGALEASMDEANTLLDSVIAPGLQEVNTKLALASDRRKAAEAQEKVAIAKLKEIANASAALDQCKSTTEIEVDEAHMQHLADQMKDAALFEEAKLAYSKFGKLPKYPYFNWEGSYDDMMAEYATKIAERDRLRSEMADLSGDMKALLAKRITETACGLCGKDLQDVPEVAAKNNALAEQYGELEGRHLDVSNAFDEAKEFVTDIDSLRNIHDKYAEFYGRYHAYVCRDNSVVPCRLAWAAEVPTEGVDGTAAKKELERLQAAQKARDNAVARLPILVDALNKAKSEWEEADAQARAMMDALVDTKALEDEKAVWLQRQTDAQNMLRETKDKHQKASVALYAAEQTYRHALTAYQEAGAKVVELRKQRDQHVFNNTLVKKIKAARPVVAAKLWTVVLAAVSTMFSSMRGTKSVVTRDADGFMVNGKPAKGVSGSTIDILGLAMRVALLKTFIPDCPFFILDEPMAACDDDRSASLISFVQTSGFDQVILVTHETVSDSLTSNLITV